LTHTSTLKLVIHLASLNNSDHADPDHDSNIIIHLPYTRLNDQRNLDLK
jgi:hypothetical protein